MSRALATATELLARWCEPGLVPPRLLVFAAHPDDDVLGLGGCLDRVSQAIDVAIVSDGAPDAPDYYQALGFARREDYARARQREAAAALRLAGVPAARLHTLGVMDQSVARDVDALIAPLMDLIAAIAPDAVMTHSYEGGHPDHDATACAVHAALHALRCQGAAELPLLEFASYHRSGAELVWGEFIADPARPARQLPLAPAQRQRKHELLECHATQRHVWQDVPLERESFRVAPRYEFREPPAAPFHYDHVDWGTRGATFLEHVRRCFSRRGIEEMI